MRALVEAKKLERKKRSDMLEAKKQLEEVTELKLELDRLKYLYGVQKLEFNPSSLWCGRIDLSIVAAGDLIVLLYQGSDE